MERYLTYDFALRKKRRGDIWLDRNIAKENLLLFKKICDSVKLDFIILYGTLLGAVRENNFIKHDYDTDTAIFGKDIDKLIEAKELLKNSGFELIRTSQSDNVFSFMRKDEYIDVYVLSPSTQLFKKYYSCDGGRIDFKHLSKLSKINFLGEEFIAPSNATDLLIKWFGGDWEIPKKNEEAMQLGIKNYYERIKRRITQVIR